MSWLADVLSGLQQAALLKDKVDRPVTMLYPGRIVGDYGLSFMGKTEPTYGYRALIIPREKRQ